MLHLEYLQLAKDAPQPISCCNSNCIWQRRLNINQDQLPSCMFFRKSPRSPHQVAPSGTAMKLRRSSPLAKTSGPMLSVWGRGPCWYSEPPAAAGSAATDAGDAPRSAALCGEAGSSTKKPPCQGANRHKQHRLATRNTFSNDGFHAVYSHMARCCIWNPVYHRIRHFKLA